ncbi:MAG TPA: ATP-binding protein [Steroidobacteraceae bacterium]|jgi:signal transduction histidine kinase/CheY-like chemotaxis protein|nr:ATP-binding protein [Steroidobacteraceae bacterium]
MTDVRTLPSGLPVSSAPAYIGPLFRRDAVVLRYGAAIVIVLLISGVRAMLAPLLGTQAPLLPFVLGVFASAYLGGRGPALLAGVLTPVLATLWFTDWPNDGPQMQWIAHVLFFLLIAALSSVLMHELQRRSRAEREALAVAADHARALSEADQRKDEFLAMLAHELRNPLAPIRNVAYVLSKGATDPETVKRSGQMIERQANHLTRLVDDLLDVARITRGRVVLKREAVTLDSVVEAALETVQPALDLRSQTVTVRRAAEKVFVDGDSVRLCQVVANLLTNASKYSPQRARIDIVIDGSGGNATIAVRDPGLGIDAQLLPHLFDLFLQGDRTLDRAQGGLGVGLTIVKLLVEMHGGNVEARSAGLGKGSEFIIRLPHVRPESVPRAPDLDVARKRPRPRRILVVEDSLDAAESMRALLRTEGHEVEVLQDGAAALARLEEFRADIVLLDIGLPRMDGYMVAHAIRERFALAGRRPRLLALTGYGRDEDRAAALKAGFDAHLAKPVDPRRLLAIIGVDESTRTVTIPQSGN